MLSGVILNAARHTRNVFTDLAKNTKSSFQSISEARYDKEHITDYLTAGCRLTAEERKQIRQKYRKVVPNVARGYDFFAAMKNIDCFDVNYLPSSYYYPYFLRILNPENAKKLLCNKSLLKFIYQTEVQQPATPLRSVAGVYFNADNRPVTPYEAGNIISRIGSPLIYKPSTDSNSGNGIHFYKEEEEIQGLVKSIRERTLLHTDRDFVIQIPVIQSKETSVFNPTSLNCMRITTLNLNGKVSTHSMTLKCGPQNSFVDNIGSGKRGVIVGVASDGTLSEFGYYGNGERCTGHNGITFKGRRIQAFDKVVNAALKLHGLVESCHVIGWDIALDINDEPILIEGNTNYPGISLEQMCSGPVFGDRIDEVISYISDYQHINKQGG